MTMKHWLNALCLSLMALSSPLHADDPVPTTADERLQNQLEGRELARLPRPHWTEPSPPATTMNADLTRDERLRILRDHSAALKHTIAFPADNAPRGVVWVFFDPNDENSARLHRDLPEYAELGIEMRYIARAWTDDMWSVWCAKDHRHAINELMAGNMIAPFRCDSHPLAEYEKLGDLLQARGTPTMLTHHGAQIDGYLSPAELAQVVEMLGWLKNEPTVSATP